MVVKKHRKRKTVTRPFCWYCERRFENDRILVMHQKARHFKCYKCKKKLGCVSALVVHMYQMHQERLPRVPNSKQNKGRLDLDIYGMEGVPVEDIIDFNNRVRKANKLRALSQKAKQEKAEQLENSLKTQGTVTEGSVIIQPNGGMLIVVFAEKELSQEEMRAQLERYK